MSNIKNKNIVKLQLDDFLLPDFELIALKTSLEDYKMAFQLNLCLGLKCCKMPQGICLKNAHGVSAFSAYLFEDEKNHLKWRLIENKSVIHLRSEGEVNHPLFHGLNEDISTTAFLIPELKAFDYLLQIEDTDDFFDIQSVLQQLQQIKPVAAVHRVDIDTIKTINNLIF